ncbi:MAG: HD domain-containing protein [Anaerolineae bacterium]
MQPLEADLARFFDARATPAYMVGGAVRDRLLGRPIHDYDIVVADNALAIGRHLADVVGGAYLTLDDEQPTARILLSDDQIDVAQWRGDSLAADLALRDFTVNAMAVPLAEWAADEPTVLDPMDGRGDLAARLLRATSESAFRHDPARLLRAPRLAAQLGSRLEGATEAWLRRDAPLLPLVSPERVRDELWRCLMLPGASDITRRLDDLGLLPAVLPEVSDLKGVTQRPPHTLDVYGHSLAALTQMEAILGALDVGGAAGEAVVGEAAAPYREELRAHLLEAPVVGRPRWSLLKLVALLHDIGKPATRTETDGLVHFYRHEYVGEEMIGKTARRLRLSSRETAWLQRVVRNHLRPLFLSQQATPSHRALYRFFRDLGDAAPDALLLSIADNRAKGPSAETPNAARGDEPVLDFAASAMQMLYADETPPVVAPPPLVTGRDLMRALTLPPGPQIGELLETVREAAAAGEVTTRDEALDLARRLAGRGDA